MPWLLQSSDLPATNVLDELRLFQSLPWVKPDDYDIRLRLAVSVPVFCPFLNCLQPFCAVHGEYY